MKNIFKIAMLCILFWCSNIKAQANYFSESNLVLVSENKSGQMFKYSTHNAYMSLNMATGDFALNADLSDLSTGDALLDSLLKAQGGQIMIFKGNISENILTYSQQQNDEKDYNMPGQLSINGNTIPCTAQFDPVNLADKNETKNYRLDFRLSVDAGKITIKSLEGKFTKQVVFEIVAGRLNLQN